MSRRVPLRWVVIGVFAFSAALNYLDRQILAALAPVLRAEFDLSNADYGSVIAVFSIAYAAGAPLAGLFIDHFGLNRGISFGVGLWSVAGIATGCTGGLGGLAVCRAVLGFAQASGIPASGKASYHYLPPKDRAFGPAVTQIGLSIGAMAAPPLATWIALRHGWRATFIVTGFLGFLWIPVWLWTSRRAAPAETESEPPRYRVSELLRDRRLWGFAAANVLSMTVYTLWTNWTTLYLKDAHGLPLAQANGLAAIPPVFAYAGGLFGGWLSMRWINAGCEPLAARRKACLASAVALLLTATVPAMPGPVSAAMAISISFFLITAWSVNLYTMPLDAFGGQRAAFSVSVLTFAYGVMQALASPAIGSLIDRHGYGPVFVIVSLMPAAAYGILNLTARRT